MSRSTLFARFANAIARMVGSPFAFLLAVALVLLWLITGPAFGFSDTWQLVINTGTTIITFLMVFLIQNTQNRDAHAMHLKLDELIRAIEGAHVAMLDLEELSDRELASVRRRYERLAAEAREKMRTGGTDTGTPDVPFDMSD
ncbi:MAG TPA: low affinity iron permease family protein [Phycisphaerales bacterium]|jgi:low affinity Fe/Cu permease|nr:low affinity iron permease family protein [Phycisphaerales bacterium]